MNGLELRKWLLIGQREDGVLYFLYLMIVCNIFDILMIRFSTEEPTAIVRILQIQEDEEQDTGRLSEF